MSQDYVNTVKLQHIQRLRDMLEELPDFLGDFFRGISETKQVRTRVAYSYDLKLFFNFILTSRKDFGYEKLKDMPLEVLTKIDSDDIEKFIEYLTYYKKETNGQTVDMQNDSSGKSRKLAAVRTMYTYFCKKRKIKENPAALVDFPKIHRKAIVRLEVEEAADFLDEVEFGTHLTDHEQKFHEKTCKRDLAIVTLMLGTGMRISECIGINITDIDFKSNGIKITRKGGNEQIIYFGQEVETALFDYLEEREKVETKEGHEDALFLSLHKRRISDRAVQILVKKYAKIVTPLKKISPHKLRSTFGTNLYRETGDIYLVADVLGHEDINTTKKHYAQMEEERRRQAAHIVKLR